MRLSFVPARMRSVEKGEGETARGITLVFRWMWNQHRKGWAPHGGGIFTARMDWSSVLNNSHGRRRPHNKDMMDWYCVHTKPERETTVVYK